MLLFRVNSNKAKHILLTFFCKNVVLTRPHCHTLLCISDLYDHVIKDPLMHSATPLHHLTPWSPIPTFASESLYVPATYLPILSTHGMALYLFLCLSSILSKGNVALYVFNYLMNGQVELLLRIHLRLTGHILS